MPREELDREQSEDNANQEKFNFEALTIAMGRHCANVMNAAQQQINTLEFITSLESNNENYNEILKQFSDQYPNLRLSSIAIEPVQRVPRYKLLTAEILKNKKKAMPHILKEIYNTEKTFLVRLGVGSSFIKQLIEKHNNLKDKFNLSPEQLKQLTELRESWELVIDQSKPLMNEENGYLMKLQQHSESVSNEVSKPKNAFKDITELSDHYAKILNFRQTMRTIPQSVINAKMKLISRRRTVFNKEYYRYNREVLPALLPATLNLVIKQSLENIKNYNNERYEKIINTARRRNKLKKTQMPTKEQLMQCVKNKDILPNIRSTLEKQTQDSLKKINDLQGNKSVQNQRKEAAANKKAPLKPKNPAILTSHKKALVRKTLPETVVVLENKLKKVEEIHKNIKKKIKASKNSITIRELSKMQVESNKIIAGIKKQIKALGENNQSNNRPTSPPSN